MNSVGYLRVLTMPRVGMVLLVTFGDRLPKYAAVLALTLHCVQDLHLSYAAAGTLIAVVTVGDILAGPIIGRYIDRWGVRPTVVFGGLGQAVFFASVPYLGYWPLLIAGFLRAFASVPTSRLARQSLSRVVPEGQLRTALAMDSIGMEIAMMAGPALAVLAVTSASSTSLFFAVSALLLASAVGWFWINPDLRAEQNHPGTTRQSWRDWCNRRFLIVLICSTAAGLTLSGTDVAIVASTRGLDQLEWAGLVITLWCGASLVGGFFYGASRRSPSLPNLILLLGLTTLATAAISSVATHWWMIALALLPAGLCCAPALTASVEQAGKAVDKRAQGHAISLQNAALSTGSVLGAPLAGFAVDQTGMGAWGYAAVAIVGIATAGLAISVTSRAQHLIAAETHHVPRGDSV